MVKLQCSIANQDCAVLFSPATTLHKLPYALGSCVRDSRLAGNIGRCGFPGATCVKDSLGNDNCAYGGDNTVSNYVPLCQNGICGGGLGAKCTNGDYDCNWGYYCNTTAGIPGVCGGYNAFADSQGDTGDFANDYCLSGKAFQIPSGSWYCTLETLTSVSSNSTSASSAVIATGISTVISTVGGTTAGGTTTVGQTITVVGSVTRTLSGTSVPSGLSSSASGGGTGLPDNGGSKHHSNTALIAGVAAGAVVAVILLIVIFILYRRSRANNRPAPSPQINQTGQFHNGYTTEPLLGLGPNAGMTPSPGSQMQQMPTGSTTPSFPNPNPYPAPGSHGTPTFTYLPEIQADSNAVPRQSYPNNAVPGGYSSSVLPNTPTSPGYAYGSAGSSPAVSPMPYAASFGSSGAGGVNSAQYAPVDSGGRDATERHLMAARMEAEKELAQMRWDGRDAT